MRRYGQFQPAHWKNATESNIFGRSTCRCLPLQDLTNWLGQAFQEKVGYISISGGRYLVRDVATFDNGPSPFHHGLVRVVRADKWGLARFDGSMIVPFQYHGLLEPSGHDQRWKACIGCHVVSDGDYHRFERRYMVLVGSIRATYWKSQRRWSVEIIRPITT